MFDLSPGCVGDLLFICMCDDNSVFQQPGHNNGSLLIVILKAKKIAEPLRSTNLPLKNLGHFYSSS